MEVIDGGGTNPRRNQTEKESSHTSFVFDDYFQEQIRKYSPPNFNLR